MQRVLTAVLSLSAGAALACSGPTCEAYFGVVPRAGLLPANAPAIGVQHLLYSESTWDGGTVRVVSSSRLSIVRADGGAVHWEPGGPADEPWALLDAGLMPGEQLRVGASADGVPCDAGAVLTVGPPAPLPAAPATVSLAGLEVRLGQGGLCGGPTGLVQHAQLRVEATSEMQPWLALARWELQVDGANYATSGFGSIGAAPVVGVPAEAGMHPVTTLHAQCAASADAGTGPDAQLGPGVHQVRLLARIVGVPAPIASNAITIDFDCAGGLDAGVPDAGPPDAGGSDGGFVTDAGLSPGFDAGAGDAGVAAAEPGLGPSAGGPGCSMTGGVWLGAALLMLARRLRPGARRP